jgi:hypothetical protein
MRGSLSFCVYIDGLLRLSMLIALLKLLIERDGTHHH